MRHLSCFLSWSSYCELTERALGDRYRQAVTELHETLAGSNADPAITDTVRSLIDRIILHANTEAKLGFLLDIEGNLAEILKISSLNQKEDKIQHVREEQIKLVAGAGLIQTPTILKYV